MPQKRADPSSPPPHDLAAERAVLATLLMDPDAWESVAGLEAEDFYLEGHRAMWRQLSHARARGERLDAVTLAHRLEQAMTAEQLAVLMLDATVPALLPPHVQTLLDHHARRTLLQLGADLTEAGTNGASPSAVDRARLALDAITERRAAHEADAPLVTKLGDDWCVTWVRARAFLRFTGFRDGHEGINAEILVQHLDRDLHWGRLSLAATSSREQLRKKLEEQAPIGKWREILDRSCRLVTDAYRAGDPIVTLEARPGLDIGYMVEPILPADQITVLFGDGGVGKGWLALSLAAAVASGRGLPPGFTRHAGGPVLYLDWESELDEQQERLAALYGATFAETGILYQRMTSALVHNAARLRVEIAQRGVVMVVVDSLAPACGLEPESSDAAVQALGVLRSFRRTCLVVAHVSGATAANPAQPGRPYGSVFVRNLARSTWEVRRSGDEQHLTMALYHRKVNRGRLCGSLACQLQFSDTGAATWSSVKLADLPELQQTTETRDRVLYLLRQGPMTAAQITSELGKAAATVRKNLERLRDAGLIVNVPDSQPLLWALMSDRA